MQAKLAKKKSRSFQIKPSEDIESLAVNVKSIDFVEDGKVNVSMKYYQRKHQCLSDWQKDEINRFSNWLDKIKDWTPSQVKSTIKTCHKHMGKRVKPLPLGLSQDLECYGLDVGSKQRVHGTFSKDTFFIIWLDREHNFLD